nr:RusA family crossover junction endodeoxyribonuclease [Salinispora arenicola]
MSALTIIAFGRPAPQGSKRHVGKGVMIESSKAVKPWRDDVKAAAEHVIRGHPHWRPLDEPLAVSMVFTLPKPASAPKRRRTWPMRLPDLSKLIRSTEDALTDAGIWRDDARVVECAARKVYPGEDQSALTSPGVVIRVRPLTTDLETTPGRPHHDEPCLDRPIITIHLPDSAA